MCYEATPVVSCAVYQGFIGLAFKFMGDYIALGRVFTMLLRFCGVLIRASNSFLWFQRFLTFYRERALYQGFITVFCEFMPVCR